MARTRLFAGIFARKLVLDELLAIFTPGGADAPADERMKKTCKRRPFRELAFYSFRPTTGASCARSTRSSGSPPYPNLSPNFRSGRSTHAEVRRPHA
jgi:hypothetical protein